MTREEIMQLNTDYLNGCESEHKMNELFSYALEQQPVTTTNNDEPITVIYPTIVCNDAISRQAVLNILFYKSDNNGEVRLSKELRDRIKNLPPVTRQTGEWIDGVHAMGYREGYKDAQKQKSGKWITDARTYYEELNKRGLGVDEYTPYFTDDIACSVCLAKYNTIDNETQFFKHCPNCGAKMESEDKE